jgi:hypothetical protein
MVDTGPCRPSAGTPPNNIDTYIVKIGADYHAFTKNEDTKYIEHATATSIDGPWDFGTDVQDWAKWGSHREGPALLDLGNGKWRLFCDGHGNGYEMYSDSSDTFATWTPLKALPNFPRISHGAVIKGN